MTLPIEPDKLFLTNNHWKIVPNGDLNKVFRCCVFCGTNRFTDTFWTYCFSTPDPSITCNSLECRAKAITYADYLNTHPEFFWTAYPYQFPRPSINTGAINVALDIDETLSSYHITDPAEAAFFHRRGLILKIPGAYYIFPGVLEFLKLLGAHPKIKVTFYSFGMKWRNVPLIDNLLKLAFGKDGIPAGKFKVLSKNERIRTTVVQATETLQKYALAQGKYAKDLTKVLGEGDLLENAVLIDNTPGNVAYGQVPNLICVKSTVAATFSKLKKPTKLGAFCNGSRFLRVMLVTDIARINHDTKAVLARREILIIPENSNFSVMFFSKETHSVTKKLLSSADEHWEITFTLLIVLRTLVSFLTEPKVEITQSEVLQSVYNLVDSNGGVTKKIARGANRIFYLTGLLYRALEISTQKNISLSESLFRLQFKIDKSKFVPNYEYPMGDDSLYEDGLKLLRGINPNLNFVTPHIYAASTTISDDERNKLELIMKHLDLEKVID